VFGRDPINHRVNRGVTEVTQSKILNYFFIGVRVFERDPINHRGNRGATEVTQSKISELLFIGVCLEEIQLTTEETEESQR
jgi:hypothetical protein